MFIPLDCCFAIGFSSESSAIIMGIPTATRQIIRFSTKLSSILLRIAIATRLGRFFSGYQLLLLDFLWLVA